ncbi:UNKNOWN [Stylonychia lemnae]|uniref:DOT1 domain-containing protein n=1 Tax=Stylonychia lemnae TaxID=5949 RepID=A0A078AF08_STYLE|nr:UNKNOWN [Stylonychia lemnae]|eukprot:CDW80107.1 UNKNOWN [Stylonychia lemnae]
MTSLEQQPENLLEIDENQAEELIKQQKIQERMNSEFEKELKRIYKEIDDLSSLLWSHKDQTQLIQRRDNKQKTRSNITTDVKEENQKWEKDTNAQFGYGEITRGALTNLISVLQRSESMLRIKLTPEQIQKLPFPLESYNLTEKSTFLDIGSGFGKPVFHASMQVYCRSKGIEVVPARVAFCIDEKYQILEHNKKKQEKKQRDLEKQNSNSTQKEDNQQESGNQNQVQAKGASEEMKTDLNNVNDNSSMNMMAHQENFEIRLVDSTYSSTYQLNERNQLPIGDVISLMTGSVESLRRLEVSLPQLRLYGIEFGDELVQKLKSIRRAIDSKLDNSDFSVNINMNSNSILSLNQAQISRLNQNQQDKNKSSKQQLNSSPLQSANTSASSTNKLNPFRRGNNNGDTLKAYFKDDWVDKTEFEVCDAAKPIEKYDIDGSDYTHIYSYNKVMSDSDRRGICKILNRTNFKIMAWYFGPEKTKQDGLRNFELLYKSPMQSTGNEKFTCYVYYKTKLFEAGVDDVSSSEEDEDENEESKAKKDSLSDEEGDDNNPESEKSGDSSSDEIEDGTAKKSSQQKPKKKRKGKKGRGRWGKRQGQSITKLESEVRPTKKQKKQSK